MDKAISAEGSGSKAKRSHTPKGQVARDRILRAAEPLFAARGFHGASMRDVADAAEVPLATVVYHFARKEGLYGAVLKDIGDEAMTAINDARRKADEDEDEDDHHDRELEAATQALIRWSLRRPARLKLLLREIVDNPARVSRAGSLPLAPVLTTLSGLVSERDPEHPYPELAVLHVVGAVSYVLAARPTVKRIVGYERERQMIEAYEKVAIDFAARAFTRTSSLRSKRVTK